MLQTKVRPKANMFVFQILQRPVERLEVGVAGFLSPREAFMALHSFISPP